MYIRIKTTSGNSGVIRTNYGVATELPNEYSFMYEWDIQRVRAYCWERSWTLEENVGPPPQVTLRAQVDKVQELVDLARVELDRFRREKSAMDRLAVSATKEQIQEIMEAIAPYIEILEED